MLVRQNMYGAPKLRARHPALSDLPGTIGFADLA